MKRRIDWAMCFALVAAFVLPAATGSARTVVGTKLLATLVDEPGFSPDPVCGDIAFGYGRLTLIWQGIDDCGGRLTHTISFCSVLPDVLIGWNGTFKIEYRDEDGDGGTLEGVLEDVENVFLPNRCVLTPGPVSIVITGGTGPFEGCTGAGEGTWLINRLATYPPCSGGDWPPLLLMSFDTNINFPGKGFCPTGKK